MGNESAYGCNFETALAWTKSFDPPRITQYESARYRNYDVTYHYDHLDLYSRMYPSLDGLVYPDRTPHTGLLEYKNVYRPVRVVSYDQKKGELLLHNYMEFDRLEDYVEISYELTRDGCILDKGMISNVHANPHEETTAKLKLSIPTEGRIYVTFFYCLKKEIPLLEQGTQPVIFSSENQTKNLQYRERIFPIHWTNVPECLQGFNMAEETI